MERFLSTWLVSSLALAFSAWLLGDHMAIGTTADSTGNQIVTLAIVGLVFTAVNLFIGPVVKLLSLPFIILTLGLALLVINALLLLLTEQITEVFDVAFMIDGFWWAVLASVVISISQSIVSAVIGRE